MNEYNTVERCGLFKVSEKHSRFLGYCFPIKSEEDIHEYLNKVKTENFAARHIPYGYVCGDKEKFSDDGEPMGTAGTPIIGVIKSQCLQNVLVVVARYFGGTLLGTSGLVKAFTSAAKGSVENAGVIKMSLCHKIFMSMEYSDYAKVSQIILNSDSRIADVDYSDKVNLTFYIKKEDLKRLKSKLSNALSGAQKFQILSEEYCKL